MKKFVADARNRWPRAVWIIGDGPYASVSECYPGTTVMLFETKAEADIAKGQIDDTGCGRRCNNSHSVINLGKRSLRFDRKITDATPVKVIGGGTRIIEIDAPKVIVKKYGERG